MQYLRLKLNLRFTVEGVGEEVGGRGGVGWGLGGEERMRGEKKARKRYLYISLHREVIIMWLVIPTYLTVTQSLNLTLASVVQIYLYIYTNVQYPLWGIRSTDPYCVI